MKTDRLDIGVWLTVAALLIAIGLTALAGDRAGVGILAVTPEGNARTTSVIRIAFESEMDSASVESRFSIDPAIGVQFIWNGLTLTVKPTTSLTPGATYTVALRSGATSRAGRQVTSDRTWSFSVATPQIVYLSPAVRSGSIDEPPNLWLVDIASGATPRQITRSATGIIDFQPSPDGLSIAYARPGSNGTADLFVLSLANGETHQITNCAPSQARCQAPDWSPDGTRLVYERIELAPGLPDEERDVPRAWIVNLRDLATAPLLSDPLLLGGAARWSPDGSKIAVYDRNLGSIAIYDLAKGERVTLETLEGESGAYAFDASSQRFAFPVMRQGPGRFIAELALIDLADPKGTILPLSGKDSPLVEDKMPAWRPGHDQIAFTRRTLDGTGPVSAQVFSVNPTTGVIAPLMVDARYVHGFLMWDPTGHYLAAQRIADQIGDAQPEIWLYDADSGEARMLVRNGYVPKWLP